MLTFDVYRDGAPATALDLAGAHLLGQEGVPVRSEIAGADGQITCIKRTGGAAGLALLWEAGSAGRYMLATTRLPERDRPYNLNLELARARLGLLIQKREDWGLFDYPGGEELSTQMDACRQAFIEALKADAADPAAAARLADGCLAEAVLLAEKTAMFHADAFLKRRMKANGFTAASFGCTADLAGFSDEHAGQLGEVSGFLGVPMPWKLTEPQEGVFEPARMDAWVEWCRRRRMGVHAGPLISFEPGFLPEWIYIWEHDYETLRDMMYEHLQRLVKRYAKAVRLWNVASALHAYNSFNLGFEQVMELTRMSCALVKQLAPRSTVLVDVALPWGEYYADNPRTIPPLMYADMCVQSGVKFDAFGVRIFLGAAEPGLYVRDLMQLSAKLDEFAGFGKPLHVTACQVPSATGADPLDFWQGGMAPELAGTWREPWSQAAQANWLESFYGLALSKPFVQSVCWRDLADNEGHYLPHGGLCGADLKPKQAFIALKRLRAQLAGQKKAKARGARAAPADEGALDGDENVGAGK